MDRDSLVYMAKLAEQAERYGTVSFLRGYLCILNTNPNLECWSYSYLCFVKLCCWLSDLSIIIWSWLCWFRFDEMVDHMKAVAQQPQELSVEERNLLSVAYKNVIGSRRASWRVISSIEQKGEPERLQLIQSYKRKIESELEDICSDILEIIKNELIPNSDSEEGKVFYYKMKVFNAVLSLSPSSQSPIIIIVNRATITAIWLSSRLETSARSRPQRH